jgi:hypothetical protein
VSFPAAPAVAADILHNNDISARYGSGRSGGNHIADTAHEMGPGTDFRGVKKSNAAAYRAAVCDFLKTKTPSIPAGASC